MTAEDIVEGDIPAAKPEGEVTDFEIVASEGNLVWTNKVKVKVKVVRVGALDYITEVITVTELDGLHSPEVVLESAEGEGTGG